MAYLPVALAAAIASAPSIGLTPSATRRAGRYSVTARCGGGNLGAGATLRVLR